MNMTSSIRAMPFCSSAWSFCFVVVGIAWLQRTRAKDRSGGSIVLCRNHVKCVLSTLLNTVTIESSSALTFLSLRPSGRRPCRMDADLGGGKKGPLALAYANPKKARTHTSRKKTMTTAPWRSIGMMFPGFLDVVWATGVRTSLNPELISTKQHRACKSRIIGKLASSPVDGRTRTSAVVCGQKG